ncbi:MAG: hypothetical protein ACUVT2_10470, partial [Thiobacillaceae bacterium]
MNPSLATPDFVAARSQASGLAAVFMPAYAARLSRPALAGVVGMHALLLGMLLTAPRAPEPVTP